MKSSVASFFRLIGILHPGLIVLTLAFAPSVARAQSDELAPLDPPYPVEIRPAMNQEEAARESMMRALLPTSSDFESMFAIQTPVKSQQSRGTCSIFSAIAMLESMMIRQGYVAEADLADLDLSEEWLEYLSTRYQTEDGSYSSKNFGAIIENGYLHEQDAPYLGDKWEEPLYDKAKERCGGLGGVNLASCLIGHWNPDLLIQPWYVLNNPSSGLLHDPEFLALRNRAHELRIATIEGNVGGGYNVWSTAEVKRLLAEGTPVTMGMTVYYGAWNHRIADELSIGRNLDHWYGGIVGYPEPGSMDLAKSLEKSAGHSILLVGYDDDVEVETTVKMQNGSIRKFKYKGVYYIKNSWGTTAFGRDFALNGESYPGYGVITQKYVQEYGSFYRFPLRPVSAQ